MAHAATHCIMCAVILNREIFRFAVAHKDGSDIVSHHSFMCLHACTYIHIVCCSVLQCVSVCCSCLTSQCHVLACMYIQTYSVLQCAAVCCSVLQCVQLPHITASCTFMHVYTYIRTNQNVIRAPHDRPVTYFPTFPCAIASHNS